MLRKAFLMALAFALSSSAAFAADVPERKSLQVINDITKQVRQYTRYTIFDDVSVRLEDNGIAVLSGKVTMPFKKDDIGRLVGRVQGVSTVQNDIAVLPVSPFDDELRFRISRAIYGNSAFWHYAAMANPPIHIVVERGRVTLTGVVQSDVERILARSLVDQFGVFSVTNKLQTVAEARDQLEKS